MARRMTEQQIQQKDRVDTLRLAIKATGLNHSDFARMIEVDVRTVRRWLEGTRSIDGPTSVLLWLLWSETKTTMTALDAGMIRDGAYT